MCGDSQGSKLEDYGTIISASVPEDAGRISKSSQYLLSWSTLASSVREADMKEMVVCCLVVEENTAHWQCAMCLVHQP